MLITLVLKIILLLLSSAGARRAKGGNEAIFGLKSWKFQNPGERFDWSVEKPLVNAWCDWLCKRVKG